MDEDDYVRNNKRQIHFYPNKILKFKLIHKIIIICILKKL